MNSQSGVPPFHLVHKDGWSGEFATLSNLWEYAIPLPGTVGMEHAPKWRWHDGHLMPCSQGDDWTIRDDAGVPVDPAWARGAHLATRALRTGKFERRRMLQEAAPHRNAPVPYTGRNRYSNDWSPRHVTHFVSRMRCFENLSHDMRHDPEMPRRHMPSKPYYPDPWEPWCAPTLSRCWKRYRRTQWKND